tara:strand:- start:1204 stop:2364 length:1161 start_codon:yes stop_codon:yes gene_type:complete
MIPYSKQYIDKEDTKEVLKILNSKILTQGPIVEKFEKKINKYVNCKFSVAVNSATSGLHIACLAAGLKKGDFAWTVPITFAATVNCIINCGAKVDFVDIDPETFIISIKNLKKKLIIAKNKGKLPKVIIPVHLGGQPHMQIELFKLSKKYKFKIIEDASHSLGAKFKNEKVGSCKWSDFSVFSFHPVKPMTTIEGGIVTTNNKIFYKKMCLFRNNGITKNYEDFIKKNGKKLPWYYEYQSSGYNYRMHEVAAGLGISQLKKLNTFIQYRNRVVKEYKKRLRGIPVSFQKILKFNKSTFHLLIIQFNLRKTHLTYKKIFDFFRANKIFVNLHYMPLHQSQFLKKNNNNKILHNSEVYSKTCMSLPVFYGIKTSQINFVCNKIKEIFK